MVSGSIHLNIELLPWMQIHHGLMHSIDSHAQPLCPMSSTGWIYPHEVFYERHWSYSRAPGRLWARWFCLDETWRASLSNWDCQINVAHEQLLRASSTSRIGRLVGEMSSVCCFQWIAYLNILAAPLMLGAWKIKTCTSIPLPSFWMDLHKYLDASWQCSGYRSSF